MMFRKRENEEKVCENSTEICTFAGVRTENVRDLLLAATCRPYYTSELLALQCYTTENRTGTDKDGVPRP